MVRLILASASPRRREILRALGIRFETQAVDLAEASLPGESPAEMVQRLAKEKALEASARLDPGPARDRTANTNLLVLGADTAVALDGALFGKPLDAADAARMLSHLSGRTHEVLTGLALMGLPSARIESKLSRTFVRFARISEEEIASYIATGEPMDKAGSYGIQERGAWFVEGIEGSYTNVVGLPVERMRELLALFGFALSDLARP